MSLYVVMGVSGCGKSTIAEALAKRTGGVFLDADNYHPPANRQKMAAGIPLTDDDRWGWLAALNFELRKFLDKPEPVFLACSALREAYRQCLCAGIPERTFIYLKGSQACIGLRLAARTGHFMSPSLLASQFATLEEPSNAITVNIDQPVTSLVEEIVKKIAD